MYEVRVLPKAEKFLDSLQIDLVAEFLAILSSLGEDPFVDGDTKFVFPVPPVMLRIWKSHGFWIIYNIEGDYMKIYNIGHQETSRPSL